MFHFSVYTNLQFIVSGGWGLGPYGYSTSTEIMTVSEDNWSSWTLITNSLPRGVEGVGLITYKNIVYALGI